MKQALFIFFFFGVEYFYFLADTLRYISFRYTTYWFDKFIHYAAFTTSAATICSAV